MDRIIEVKVFGNYLTKDSNRAGVRGEGNAAKLRITFDESWDEFAKEVIFWDAYGQNPVKEIITIDQLEDAAKSTSVYLVSIPQEAMARAGMLTFSIRGTLNEVRQVAITGTLEVDDSPDVIEEPNKIKEDDLTRMQTQLEAIKDGIQGMAKAEAALEGIAGRAETSASKAETAKTNAQMAASAASANSDNAKDYADSAAASAEAANKTANLVDLNVGSMSQELSEMKAEMEAHKASFDHPDKSIKTEKIEDGAVTGDKIADETISKSKLNEDVIGLITSNKFDGYIATIADADGIDNRDNPHNVRIFRVGSDNGKGEGGILIVSGDTNTLYEHHPLEGVEQTYITHDGYINTRHATNWDGYDGLVFEWSEWKSTYADVDDAITKTDFATNSPGSGQYGKPGIIRLGHMQGFKMVDNALVLDAATPNVVKTKASSLLPITPTVMAYAVALATHQQIGDNYNTEDFTVVHESKQNNESYYFPLNKDKLPVSYGAVKKAMPYTVDENNNAQFKSGISGGSVCSDYFETVGYIYNNCFCINLSGALYLEIYSGDPIEIFNTSKYVRVTIAGITVTIPRDKFEYFGTGDCAGTNPDNSVYWYKGFINDYPQFADYGEEMPDGDVAVAYETSCYKIDSDGAAEFTSLTVPHMYLTSPDNSIYKVTVNNNGDLETTKVTFDENGNEIIVPPDIEFE